MRRLLAEALRGEGHRVQTAGDVPGATEALTQTVFDVVVSDVRLPGGDGFDILRRLREESPATEVVLMTAFGTIEDAVAAMKERAFDYITKPFDTQEFLLRVGKAGERRRLREELLDARTQLASMADKPLLVGQSPVLLRLQDQATRVASTDVSVLVIGESGTGKELVARLIHEQSSRAGKAFVAVNCGAVPMSLIEAELFGHE
ncbi:MAG: sigma-54-dependent Fis family transcriptional regulator, partial [Myxococcales bacterium]|nr:sigma-54-dependent Fis family transcriptional regulator [Myxococcales bacterium]